MLALSLPLLPGIGDILRVGDEGVVPGGKAQLVLTHVATLNVSGVVTLRGAIVHPSKQGVEVDGRGVGEGGEVGLAGVGKGIGSDLDVAMGGAPGAPEEELEARREARPILASNEAQPLQGATFRREGSARGALIKVCTLLVVVHGDPLR